MRIVLLSLTLALGICGPVVAGSGDGRAAGEGCVVSLWGEECEIQPRASDASSDEAWASIERQLPLALKYIRDQAEAGNCRSAWVSANASGHPRLQAEARARCGEPPRTETPPAAPLIELW
ncbi:MAG: hypothetical protein AB1760_10160 [Pseudomonadota bacterium]